MALFITDDGTTHPISDATADILKAGFGDDWQAVGYEGAERRKAAIMGKERFGTAIPPTDAERATIRACDAVGNLNRAWHFMEGRDYREVFGPTATLCQVHGQTHSPDTCDCVLREVFDHHKRGQQDAEVHPHHPHRVCKQHKHLEKDFKAHHRAVKEHNRVEGAKRRAAAETLAHGG